MYTLIIIIHVIISILLIIAVLLQSGKGGGLIESFSAAESIFGTKTPAFMARLTTVLVVLFFSTTLSLAFLSKQRTKSLVESKGLVEETTKEATLPKEIELPLESQGPVESQPNKVVQPDNKAANLPITTGDQKVPQN
jgi:preprotein translocase subunit SecG